MTRLHRWKRGVDLSLFRPEGALLVELAGLAGPILLQIGRVAPEKNINAPLAAAVPEQSW